MIVIVPGAPSIGKTAVAGELVEHLDRGVLVAGDSLVGLSGEALKAAEGQVMTHGLSLIVALFEANIRALVENRFDVVVDWFFPMDTDLPLLLDHLKLLEKPVHVFVLTASPEEHLRRDQARPEDWRIGEKGVRHFETHDELERVPVGTPVDTTGMTRDEVVDSILTHLGRDGQPTAPADR